MVLHLAEELEVPLRERNRLLLAAGYAPVYEERDLEDPAMEAVHRAVAAACSTATTPTPRSPSTAAGRSSRTTAAAALLMAGLPEHLLAPPMNVLRASLHPDGLAPRIVNLGQWRRTSSSGLGRQAALTGDPALRTLLRRARRLPGPGRRPPARPATSPCRCTSTPRRASCASSAR